MVAMMICTIGLVSMAELMAVTLRLQQLGRNSTAAIRIAQDKIDELTTLPFDDAVAGAQVQCGGSLTADVTNYNEDSEDLEGRTFYRLRWTVSAGPDGDLNLRQVTMRVIPVSKDNRTVSSFDLTTVVRGVAAPCP